eukprot:m.53334 g.53334  ORF g.53334 m.53334 type:complete len:322 (+) comp7446_c0_seq1:23-988(+)
MANRYGGLAGLPFFGLGLGFPGGYRKATKAKKKSKPKKDNWFQACTVEQLKSMCRACKLPVSGSKGDLESRLLHHSDASRYAHNAARSGWANCRSMEGMERAMERRCNRPLGISVAELKDDLEDQGLSQAGNRFDLVLRLLQAKSGVGEVAKAKPKPTKPRAPPMALPNPEKLRARMNKTAFPGDARWKWSNYKSKQHYNRCAQLAEKLVQEQVVDRKLIERGHIELAWKVVMAVCEDWMMNHGDVRGIGYYYESGSSQADALVGLADETIAAGAKGQPYLEPVIEFFDDCQDSAREYGYEGEEMNFFGRISDALRGGPVA